MEFFLKFDVFTVNSFFQYESNKKVASYPGLFFSIFIYVFLLYTFIKSDMVQKTNPKTSDIIKGNSLNEGNFEVSSKNFRITIHDYDKFNNITYYQYFDPQIWSFQFFLSKNNIPETSISLMNCTFSTGRLCLNDTSTLSFNHKTNIYIWIGMCVNSSQSNIICKPAEEIYNFVRGVNFILEFSETLFDLNNYDNPIEDNYSPFVTAFLNPNFLDIMNFLRTEKKIRKKLNWVPRFSNSKKMSLICSKIKMRKLKMKRSLKIRFFH